MKKASKTNELNQQDDSDPFQLKSSKIRPIYLPIIGFKNRDNKKENSTSLFLGRKNLIRKLKGWLNDNFENGVYLISGYRGMGKTRFVDEVLKEIHCDNPNIKSKPLLRFINSSAYWAICIFSICLFSSLFWEGLILSGYKNEFYYFTIDLLKKHPYSVIFWLLSLISFAITTCFISDRKTKEKKIAIKLNLGSEILEEREILAIISKMLFEKYSEYKSSYYYYHPKTGIILLHIKAFLCVVVTFIITQLSIAIIAHSGYERGFIYYILKKLSVGDTYYYLLILFSLLIYPIVRSLFKSFFYYFSNAFSSLKSVPSNILRNLALLNERINALVCDEKESSLKIKSSLFRKKKGRSYPLANVREIEQELTLILENIKNISIIKAPKFIFIFDELDKIDGVPADTMEDKEILPEYENAISGFPGGATSRKRKQNILSLLANMKYFISTARAKFIFISSRELYDASLSDVSDREFAISSIFTGVIYLDSFLSPQNNLKEVSSMTEKYICNHLIPYDFILYLKISKLIGNIEHVYTKDNINKNNQDIKKIIKKLLNNPDVKKNAKELRRKLIESDKILKKDPIVRLKKNIKYTQAKLLSDIISGKLKEDLDRDFGIKADASEEQKEFFHYSINHISEDEDYYSLKTYNAYLRNLYLEKKGEEESSLSEENIQMIDKVIIQLYHFSIYLTHISNGAPQKIASYFEKYAMTGVNYNNKDIIKIKGDNVSTIKEETRYLIFKYRDQQRINFIHYMAYPVMQAVINTSSNFGDKLLLTAAFLTDHIYKHHKDGFSWRNIELVPELLDADKTPELRSFINSIICFLKQTHLSTIYSGVYNLKFPRKISEEISVFSKLSEEVAAIFNFTLDESFSVKKYYAKLANYYSSQSDSSPKPNNPYPADRSDQRILANIHHILADLYLSEEDFSNAIFEYQKCASLLGVNRNYLEQITASTILFHIRNMLKLGLAYERRNTFNSAYFVYQELTSLLISYRYFDENTYGLEYNQNLDIAKYKDSHKKLNKEEVLPKLIKNKLSDMNQLIPKLALFEDVRFIYQPLLAKLFVVEKMEFGGVTRDKMAEIEDEFKFMSRLVNEKEKFFVIANFYREMGDIMYYKNGFLQYKIGEIGEFDKLGIRKSNFNDPIKAWDLWSYDIEDTTNKYIDNLKKELTKLFKEDDINNLAKFNNDENKEKEDTKQKTEVDFEAIERTQINKYLKNKISDYLNFKINKENLNNNTSELQNEIKVSKVWSLYKDDIYNVIDTYIERLKDEIINIFKDIDETNFAELINSAEDDEDLESILNDLIFKNKDDNNENTRYHFKQLVVEYIQKETAEGDNKEIKEKNASRIIFKKTSDCYYRRKYCSNNKNYYPCYACKFYNKSLRILLKNTFNTEETESELTKTILLWNCLYNAITPPREDTLVLIANILNSFGSVMLSCSNDKDNISDKFLDTFFKAIELSKEKDCSLNALQNDAIKNIFEEYNRTIKTKKCLGMSFLEKGILYFYVASEFYRSSDSKESSYCYEKILNIFLSYLKNQQNDVIKSHIDDIKKYIVNDSIKYIYSNYEKINISELQKLKWIFPNNFIIISL